MSIAQWTPERRRLGQLTLLVLLASVALVASPARAATNLVRNTYRSRGYREAVPLDDPASSRFVVRVRDESHNCWTSSCATDGQTMANAIAA